MMSTKIKSIEQDYNNINMPPQPIMNQKGNNPILQSRFEETNAALDRAFERISVLESENNRLLDSVSTEKGERNRIQKELDTKTEEYRKIHGERKKIEMEKANIRESLRVNNEQVEEIKRMNIELERRNKAILEENKIICKHFPFDDKYR